RPGSRARSTPSTPPSTATFCLRQRPAANRSPIRCARCRGSAPWPPIPSLGRLPAAFMRRRRSPTLALYQAGMASSLAANEIRRGWAGIDLPAKLDSPSDCLVKMPYGAPRGAESPKDLEAAMRLVAAACTLVVVAFLAVFGAILLHERTIADT